MKPFEFYTPSKKYRATLYDITKPLSVGVKELIKDIKAYFKKLPVLIVQPKYDGFRVELHRAGNRVEIWTEDGSKVTRRFPTIVDALRKLPLESFVFEGELERYLQGRHVPRELAIGAAHRKGKRPDEGFVVSIFEVLYLNGKDLTKKTNLERVQVLKRLPIKQNTFTPTRGALNICPTFVARNAVELAKALKTICSVKHFEGAVLKPAHLTYYAPLYYWKFKKFITFALVALKIVPTKAPGVVNVEVGAPLGDFQNLAPSRLRKLDGKQYAYIGRTYNTKLKVKEGDIVAVRCFNVSLTHTERGDRVSIYGPQVDKILPKGTHVNTVTEIINAARHFKILHEKKI